MTSLLSSLPPSLPPSCLICQEELSKDLRSLLDSEAKRGDVAELALREAQLRTQQQDRELGENRGQLTAAAVQLAALEAALQEKMDQVRVW